MGKREDDPVSYGDFMQFKASVESRLAAFETEQKWIKQGLSELRRKVESLDSKLDSLEEKISGKIDRYKWWIFTSIIGGVILSWIVKLVMAA